MKSKSSPHFVAFVKEAASSESAKTVASNHGWSESCVHYGDVRQAIVYLKEQTAPKILLVEIPSAEEAPELLDKLADVCVPSMHVIVTGDINEFSFYSWLQSIGIEHYLLQPFDSQSLNQLIKNKDKNLENKGIINQTIAVIGARGGVGSTTISCNLAHLLAETHGNSTALIDTDPYFGSVANAFDIDPNHGLRDILEKPDRIDEMFLNQVMVSRGYSLKILAAEETYSELLSNSASASNALIETLGQLFSYTLFDLPCHLNALTRSVLAQADHVIIVGEPSLLSLRDMLRMRDYLQKNPESEQSITYVLNRCDSGKESDLTIRDFSKNLGEKVTITIAETQDAPLATSAGEMLVESTNQHQVKASLHQLAEIFLDEETYEPQEEGESWINQLIYKFLGRKLCLEERF